MNIERHLILVKDEDKTEQISNCEYVNGKWQVVYHNNSKVYTYNFINVIWLRGPKVIWRENLIVYSNNQPISGIEKLIDFGKYIRLIFKTGYSRVYDRTSILIEESCLNNRDASNCFEYLSRLADHVSIRLENDISLLSKQYSKITTVSPRSVLSAYLEGKPLNKDNNMVQPIFPFGFNLSQKSATEKALSNQISIIEGPPGTGKTQTILNIIANAVMNDKTVAVVSNNNSATANVLEKLQKFDMDFIAAYLGSNDNKEKFFTEQISTYPNMSDWTLSKSDFHTIMTRLNEAQHKLNLMLEYKNKQAALKQQLSVLQTEHEYFNRYYIDTNGRTLKLRSFLGISADKVLTVMMEYLQNVEKGSLTLKEKLFNLFAYGIYSLKFFDNSPEEIISFLQKTYYDQRTKELEKQIKILSGKLDSYNFDNEMIKFSKDSMIVLKAKLAERYRSSDKRRVFTNDAIRKSFDSFIKEYPVILSTTHSLRSCACEDYLFNFVIIDEASQVDLVTGALTLSCAKKAVIVGDIKQLPNVVSSEVAEITKQIFDAFKLDSAYSYADNSLLSSILSLYKDIPKTLLKEHYRCHPKIIGFCNQKFYDNQLVVLTSESENDKPLMVYKTTKGNHARGKLNQRQIDVIFEEIIPGQKIDDTVQSVGIISPYRLQADELRKNIGLRNIEADTVHKYQGREKDVIILTTVANEVAANDFVDNPNLINVAVSRAVDKLIVVVSDSSDEWKGTNIGDLIGYIQYNNFEIIHSEIYSVFDLLYSNYSDKLLSTLKNSKRISKYSSENLMNTVIERVLKSPEFCGLDRVIHQPLKMLIKDPIKLTEDECKYAMNILTHTDFVIFNKLDKMPVLVVEVDGYSYHANNPKQLERDGMKDEILRKYDIPILRIKTNESGEEDKIRKKLVEIMIG